jgi:hypothetical protein
LIDTAMAVAVKYYRFAIGIHESTFRLDWLYCCRCPAWPDTDNSVSVNLVGKRFNEDFSFLHFKLDSGANI